MLINVSASVTLKETEMRERILTENEKQAIKEFLETGKSSVIVRMARYRGKKFLPILRSEIDLLDKFLAQKEVGTRD